METAAVTAPPTETEPVAAPTEPLTAEASAPEPAAAAPEEPPAVDAAWARALVEEILDDIADAEELPARYPSEDLTPGRMLEPLLQRLADEGTIALVRNTLRSERGTCRLLEVQTLQQSRNGSCGFYALHNAMLVLHALRAAIPDTAEQLLRELKHRASFWRDYSRLKRRLIARSQQEACPPHRYPWGARLVNGEVLERSHLNFLLVEYPELRSLGGAKAFTNLSELAFETACALHEEFQKFRSVHHNAHTFIVGDTNHWFAVVAHRTGTCLELVVLDSLNRGVTLLPPAVDEADIHEYLRHKKLTEEEYRTAVLCRREARDIIHLLARCLLGDEDIRAYYVKGVVDNMVDCFHRRCVAADTAPQDMTPPERVLNWLSNYYPPPVVRSVLREAQAHSSEATRRRLHHWAAAVRELCPNLAGEAMAETLKQFNCPPRYFQQLVAEAATVEPSVGG